MKTINILFLLSIGIIVAVFGFWKSLFLGIVIGLLVSIIMFFRGLIKWLNDRYDKKQYKKRIKEKYSHFISGNRQSQ